MQSRKVKNIVLVILVITNLLLLFLMVSQRLESRQLQEKTLTDAVQLLEAKGISVRAENLSRLTFPPAMTLERDTQQELRWFTALLGEGTTTAQRGLVSQFEGPLGSAEVLADGSFSVTLAPGAYPLESGTAETVAIEALKRINFTAKSSAQEGEAQRFLQIIQDFPVYSCLATATCEGDSLVSISGRRLAGQPAASGGECLNLATLLIRFRANIIDSGDACTAITSAQAGYVLSSVGGSGELVPVLRLETDTGTYYLSALTGELMTA